MIAGRLYRCADAELVAARIHARQVMRAYNATDPAAGHERRALLAGLFAGGETAIREPGPSRDHTERMLRAFGVAVRIAGLEVHLAGGLPIGCQEQCAGADPQVSDPAPRRGSPLPDRTWHPSSGSLDPARVQAMTPGEPRHVAA
jgi:hypothetical protein